MARFRRSREEKDLALIVEGAPWERVEAFAAPTAKVSRYRAETISSGAVRQLNRIAKRMRKPSRLL